MNRNEFIALFADELTGRLLCAQLAAEPESLREQPLDYARRGAFLLKQMRAAKEILGRMYDALDKPIKPVTNGVPAQPEARKR